MSKPTEAAISQVLEVAYEKALGGFAGMASAVKLAESYKKAHPGDKRKQADALINWQIVNGASSGFLAGLGGFITLPVTVPLELASLLFFQVRMIVAIAVIGGYDPKDEKIKALVFSCLAGKDVKDLLKEVGIFVGGRIVLKGLIIKKPTVVLGRIIVQMIPRHVIPPTLAKGGIKWVPILGGVVGGAMNAVWVAEVGKTATLIFVESDGIVTSDDIADGGDTEK
jgi:hypothetical protein